jgi:ribosomal-protein-alanine N-acetyltransferase
MQASDLPEVHRLEVMCEAFPWPRWLFRRQLRARASCWVLEEGGHVVGFGIVAFEKNQAHITNMCVARGYRRRGLGRRMLLHLLGVARRRHCPRVWLEVRATNRPAILLYRKLGFRTRTLCRGYYPARGGRQNGLIMARPIRGAVRRRRPPAEAGPCP